MYDIINREVVSSLPKLNFALFHGELRIEGFCERKDIVLNGRQCLPLCFKGSGLEMTPKSAPENLKAKHSRTFHKSLKHERLE